MAQCAMPTPANTIARSRSTVGAIEAGRGQRGPDEGAVPQQLGGRWPPSPGRMEERRPPGHVADGVHEARLRLDVLAPGVHSGIKSREVVLDPLHRAPAGHERLRRRQLLHERLRPVHVRVDRDVAVLFVLAQVPERAAALQEGLERLRALVFMVARVRRAVLRLRVVLLVCERRAGGERRHGCCRV